MQESQKARNDPDSVAERAEQQLAKVDYNDFALRVPNTRISQAILELPDYERFEITKILSEAYERTPVQDRILKILSLSEKGYALRDCTDSQAIAKSGDAYFMRCMSQNIQPMLSGLAQWLDITERELTDAINAGGERGKQLERLLQMIRAYADDAALSGEHVPAIARWHDSSRWGITETTRVNVTYTDETDVKQRLSEIAKGLAQFTLQAHGSEEPIQATDFEVVDESGDGVCPDETSE